MDGAVSGSLRATQRGTLHCPCVGLSRPHGAHDVDTDASRVGVGAVLSQKDSERRERVLGDATRALNKPERNYCVTWRELLRMIFGVRNFAYLAGARLPFGQTTACSGDYWLPRSRRGRWPNGSRSWAPMCSKCYTCPRKKHSNTDGLHRCHVRNAAKWKPRRRDPRGW